MTSKLKQIKVPVRSLAILLVKGATWHTIEGVPFDAELRGAYYDGESHSFCMIFEHPTFSPTLDEEIPVQFYMAEHRYKKP